MEKGTFLKFKRHAIGAEEGQYLVDVVDVWIDASREPDNIIKVGDAALAAYAAEYNVQCTLEGDGCFPKAERHARRRVGTHMTGKVVSPRLQAAIGIYQKPVFESSVVNTVASPKLSMK